MAVGGDGIDDAYLLNSFTDKNLFHSNSIVIVSLRLLFPSRCCPCLCTGAVVFGETISSFGNDWRAKFCTAVFFFEPHVKCGLWRMDLGNGSGKMPSNLCLRYPLSGRCTLSQSAKMLCHNL